MTNVQTIRITGELNDWQRWRFFGELGNKSPLLRTARKIGDIENVNHTVLGELRRQQVPFEKLSAV